MKKILIIGSIHNHGIDLLKGNKNFEFVKGDILDIPNLDKHMKRADVVIHLAAMVGYMACDRNKILTKNINVEGTNNVVDLLKDNQYLLFGSTGSNYGKVTEVCTETTSLNPTTLYGVSKTQAEELVMSKENSTAFRFATAFGISHRLRMDLLVNDLVYKL